MEDSTTMISSYKERAFGCLKCQVSGLVKRGRQGWVLILCGSSKRGVTGISDIDDARNHFNILDKTLL